MKKSIIKCFKSFKYAWEGVKQVIRNENNMKYHLLAVVLVFSTGLFLSFSLNEWIISILCIGLVLVTETMNTAIEKLVDFISPDIHPKAKNIKDISAGAVLIASFISAIVWILVIISHFKAPI